MNQPFSIWPNKQGILFPFLKLEWMKWKQSRKTISYIVGAFYDVPNSDYHIKKRYKRRASGHFYVGVQMERTMLFIASFNCEMQNAKWRCKMFAGCYVFGYRCLLCVVHTQYRWCAFIMLKIKTKQKCYWRIYVENSLCSVFSSFFGVLFLMFFVETSHSVISVYSNAIFLLENRWI